MHARSASLLGIVLAMAVVAWLWLDPWGGQRPGSRTDEDEARGSGAGEVEGSPPGLVTRPRGAPGGREDAEIGTRSPEDVWTIEVTEVIGPDGRPVVGAEVFVDQVCTVNRTWPWEGRPVRLRFRPWVEDATQREADERAGYLPCDDTPVYLSVRHEGFASWFAPALRYGGPRETRLRAVLGPRRTLRGRLVSQDGVHPPEGGYRVQVRAAHVPADMFRIEATLEADGRFAFDGFEAVPAGSLVVEAYSPEPFEDGLPASVEVGPKDEEVVVVLRRAHRFRFVVTFAEDPASTDLAPRFVRIEPPAGAGPRVAPAEGYRGVTGSGGDGLQALLPEGALQTWRAVVPGYAPVDLELRATGEEREHVAEVRFQPAPQSGLLALDIRSPDDAVMTGAMFLQVKTAGKEDGADPPTRWRLDRVKRTRGTVRLPSGVRHGVHLEANVQRRSGSLPWTIPPFEVELVAGGRLERSVEILLAAALQVTRKRRGGLMPELAVRLTHGSDVRTWSPWRSANDLIDGGPVYLMLGRVEAGTWTVELLRGGKVLDWAERVQVVLGKVASIRIPDDVVLPASAR